MNHNVAYIVAYNVGLQSRYDASLNDLLGIRRKAIKELGALLDKRSPVVRIKAIEFVLKFTGHYRVAQDVKHIKQ